MSPPWTDSKKILYHDTNLHVWVLDVESGKARIVGNDPWMVPQRTLYPTWSPDSTWVAFASRLKEVPQSPGGSLVGKRTWGGLVHTADTPGFIDGGSMIAPPTWGKRK